MILKQSKGKKLECNNCDRPTLMVENREVLLIWKNYRNGIINDGIDMLAIDKAMEYENIPMEERPLLAEKLILWCTIILNKQQERLMTNGQP